MATTSIKFLESSIKRLTLMYGVVVVDVVVGGGGGVYLNLKHSVYH